ncbi:hypothetical protein [Nocardioides sp.]|uniref:hypothetical protein n=1 Tax=Nocardioides sp. TaxID=35761 RepID=UPI002623B061|nr:hypothetical protein [Nocardioides sp.]MDI6912199.1 hypothetical protein [Nocardioides sp.]
MPYPEDHPFRAAFAETHNRITNIVLESKMTDGYWRANVGENLTFILGQLDLLTYAVENLMDQVDYDPERYRPRPIDEV